MSPDARIGNRCEDKQVLDVAIAIADLLAIVAFVLIGDLGIQQPQD
jgi:hypothetical protein